MYLREEVACNADMLYVPSLVSSDNLLHKSRERRFTLRTSERKCFY